jgi:hypothetical protein
VLQATPRSRPLGLVVEEVDSDPATSPSRQPKAARNRTRAIARYRVALSHVGRPALSHERGFALSHVLVLALLQVRGEALSHVVLSHVLGAALPHVACSRLHWRGRRKFNKISDPLSRISRDADGLSDSLTLCRQSKSGLRRVHHGPYADKITNLFVIVARQASGSHCCEHYQGRSSHDGNAGRL